MYACVSNVIRIILCLIHFLYTHSWIFRFTVITVSSDRKKIISTISICLNVCIIAKLILTALEPWTRHKVLLNGSPSVRTLSSPISSGFERHSISLRWPFLSRGAGRARARCAHVPPKTLAFFYLRITTSQTRPLGFYAYGSIPMSFVRGSSRRSRTDFAYTKRKVDERSLTFQLFVVWSGYDRSILFERNDDKEGAR